MQKKSESRYNEAKICAQSGDKAKAINLLNQVLKNDPHYYMAFFGLADIYHETGERQLEREALINGLQTGSERFPKGYRFLAELLYADADYSEALKNIENYNRLKNPLTIEENRLLESCRFAVKAVGSPVDYQPENSGEAINTSEDEYWPSLNGEANTLVFTRLITMDKDGRKLAYSTGGFLCFA